MKRNTQPIMRFRFSKHCFENAISKGKLTLNPGDDNYIGNYMYMHSDETTDSFKNIITRKYDVVVDNNSPLSDY